MELNIALLNKRFQDMNPLLLGWQECEPGHSFGPHIREYYLIHYVVRGRGILYKEEGTYPACKGQLFLIRPFEVTTYTADREDPWEYIWVGFDGSQAKRLDQLPEPVRAYGENTFFDMLKCEEWKNTKEEYVASKLFELLAVLFEGERRSKRYERQVEDYIRSNYMRAVTVEEIAAVVGLDRRYLTRIFKRYSGRTIQEYLILTRLRHAEELLSQGYSVGQVSVMIGYEDGFHFSKMFKKEYGVSPQRWQQEHLEK